MYFSSHPLAERSIWSPARIVVWCKYVDSDSLSRAHRQRPTRGVSLPRRDGFLLKRHRKQEWRSPNAFPHHLISVSMFCVSVRSHLAGDPVWEVCDACVNARGVFLPATVAPADQTHQSHPAVLRTHERTAGIPLKKDEEKLIHRCTNHLTHRWGRLHS